MCDLNVVVRQRPRKLGLRARSQANAMSISDLRGRAGRAGLQILLKKLTLASFTPHSCKDCPQPASAARARMPQRKYLQALFTYMHKPGSCEQISEFYFT